MTSSMQGWFYDTTIGFIGEKAGCQGFTSETSLETTRIPFIRVITTAAALRPG